MLIVTALAVFAAAVLWAVFFGTLVRERVRRRGTPAHSLRRSALVFAGYVGGPLVYGALLAYELADGTIVSRRREAAAELYDFKADLAGLDMGFDRRGERVRG